jgi:hypothetical protein
VQIDRKAWERRVREVDFVRPALGGWQALPTGCDQRRDPRLDLVDRQDEVDVIHRP